MAIFDGQDSDKNHNVIESITVLPDQYNQSTQFWQHVCSTVQADFH